jgi:hypothetical protein
MGSELLVGVLEIDKGKKPDWATAEALLARLSDEEVKSAYVRAMDLDEAPLEEQGVELPRMRAELQGLWRRCTMAGMAPVAARRCTEVQG